MLLNLRGDRADTKETLQIDRTRRIDGAVNFIFVFSSLATYVVDWLALNGKVRIVKRVSFQFLSTNSDEASEDPGNRRISLAGEKVLNGCSK